MMLISEPLNFSYPYSILKKPKIELLLSITRKKDESHSDTVKKLAVKASMYLYFYLNLTPIVLQSSFSYNR